MILYVLQEEDIHKGTYGIMVEPLSEFFNFTKVGDALGADIVTLSEFLRNQNMSQSKAPDSKGSDAVLGLDADSARLSLLIRFEGGRLPACTSEGREISAYGVRWVADREVCMHANKVQSTIILTSHLDLRERDMRVCKVLEGAGKKRSCCVLTRFNG